MYMYLPLSVSKNTPGEFHLSFSSLRKDVSETSVKRMKDVQNMQNKL